MKARQWTARIYLTEDGDETQARAVLTTQDSWREETAHLVGRGTARRDPGDRAIPEIGDELAAGRALEDLAIRLHEVASDDIAHLAAPPDRADRADRADS
ncbi:dsRBD fold-containing protein [Streptomyces griseoviridis]|uniref:dsRBD fold-containing protein n=1 Tax=Streptomyces griseoviridis TaxID=45398 RepID=UPI0034546937